ncbi:MAG: 30S ribosomal protein S1 [Deltaproteobacteria bacterium]|nr:30S ribosomal protein S1 [Deltaproteobacteria bacterium]
MNNQNNDNQNLISFEDLLNQTLEQEKNLEEGNIIKGTIVKISKDFVIVDIGYKSEGEIPISQFIGVAGKPEIQIGDQINVFLNHLENENGLVELSKEKADRMRVWDEISDACEQESIIEGIISQRVKGGLSVTISGGVKAFLPGSQVDLRPIRNLEKLIGEKHEFKIIKFNKKRGNIVLSRRALLEEERNSLKEQTLESLQEESVVEGIVKNITEYGAFVDLGGIDGLLHITDMSWGRIGHPSEMLKVGDKIDVKILKYNEESERVSLGLKQTQPDPWADAVSRYPIGLRVSGKVVSVTDYGAFVELEQGIEGLIHVSEMSWTKRVKHPSKILEVGEEVECAILDVDTEAQRISLGLKQLEPHPWEHFTSEYKIDDIIKGKIRSITDYGVFIGIDDNIDGMVHKSDLSWTQRINHPSEMFRKGDEVEAKILNIDIEEEKVSLGIKQLYEDPWERIPMEYPLGQVREVKVIKITDFGAFVELEPGIEGLIHVSELSSDRVDDPKAIIKEGETIKAEIITLDTQERKIGLSIKSLTGEEEAGDMTEYAKSAPKKTTEKATLGDLMNAQMEKISEKTDEAEEDSAADESEE